MHTHSLTLMKCKTYWLGPLCFSPWIYKVAAGNFQCTPMTDQRRLFLQDRAWDPPSFVGCHLVFHEPLPHSRGSLIRFVMAYHLSPLT